MAWEYYGEALQSVLPAVGTHFPLTEEEKSEMFGAVPHELFRNHDWQHDLTTLGRVPADFIREVSDGRLAYDWPAEVNSSLVDGDYDLILSIGQVVPHEVVGMANHSKNIFIGTGGREAIHKSHYLGAVCGLEEIMGRIDTPVRRVLNYASTRFARELPIVYALTVVGPGEDGELAVKGLFIGDDAECFNQAARLSQAANVTTVPNPLETAVVYLDPREYKSTWIGNKAIYRTRMAMADGGHLIVLAPGVRTFGENEEIDRLIRETGYIGTDRVVELVEGGGGDGANRGDGVLSENLAAAAHLIHGSTEGRFSVTYCAGGLSRGEIEGANYQFGDVAALSERYLPSDRRSGLRRTADGEEYYFISNPGLGLWSTPDRLQGR
jgi:nickel-dependent lactate racemase